MRVWSDSIVPGVFRPQALFLLIRFLAGYWMDLACFDAAYLDMVCASQMPISAGVPISSRDQRYHAGGAKGGRCCCLNRRRWERGLH